MGRASGVVRTAERNVSGSGGGGGGSGNVSSPDFSTVTIITEAEYAALSPPDAATVYILMDVPSSDDFFYSALYFGSQRLQDLTHLVDLATGPGLGKLYVELGMTPAEVKAVIESASNCVVEFGCATFDVEDDITFDGSTSVVGNGATLRLLNDVTMRFPSPDENTHNGGLRIDANDTALNPFVVGVIPVWTRIAQPWTRVGTVATIEIPFHQLSVSDPIILSNSNNTAAVPNNTYLVTSVVDGNFVTFTCLNAGATSGTVDVVTGDWYAPGGSKCTFDDFVVRDVAAGGTAALFANLQNSSVGLRILSSDDALEGLRVDYGCKNVRFPDLQSSSIDGYTVIGTTSAGDQQTSKIFWTEGGLFENSAGIMLGDIELADFELGTVNASPTKDNTSAIFLTSDGNRDTDADGVGNGPNSPSFPTFRGGQLKGFDAALKADAAVDVEIGGFSIEGTGYSYLVLANGVTIREPRKHRREPSGGTWDPASIVTERDTVLRHVAPISVPILTNTAPWANQPSAQTELLGVSSYRHMLDLREYKSGRLGGNVEVAGATNAVVNLAFRSATVVVVTNSGGATGGTWRITVVVDGVSEQSAAIAYNAPATGANSVETKMENMAIIGSGGVSVSGSTGGPWTITFSQSLTNHLLIPLPTIADSTTGGSPGANITRAFAADTPSTDLQIPLGSVGQKLSDWSDLDSDWLLANVLLIPYGSAGDAAADPTVGGLFLELA